MGSKFLLFYLLKEKIMRKLNLLVALICLLSLLSLKSYAQRTLPATENFDYPVGNLPIVGTDWSNFVDPLYNIGHDTAKVISGNLVYPNYPMPSSGNRLSIAHPGGQLIISTLYFTPIKNPGNKIYASFLLQVSSKGGLIPNPPDSVEDNEPRLFGFSNGALAGWSHLSVSIILRNDTTGGFNNRAFNIGLIKGANHPNWSPVSYNYGSATILLVLNYEFVAGANNNDTARLWINPDLTGPEPPPTIKAPGTIRNGDDPDSLCYFFVRTKTESPIGSVDAIRIATEWNQAPLPVELSQFSAKVTGSFIQLNWKTETEINDYGFDIQRSEICSQNKNWETIGFVNGSGNSNSPKNYFFTDRNVSAGKHLYRLKQIDNDGQFDYSKSIEVDLGAPSNFRLDQNYPNPFNPSTKISYNLPEAVNVKLIVYNLLGQEIKILKNKFEDAGVYSIDFDASELNSGLYLYKLEAGSFTQTRKMLLMK